MKKTFKTVEFSTIDKDNEIQLSIKTEDIFVFLLGNTFHHYYDCKLTKREWKTIVRKCIAKLKEILIDQINTDGHHRHIINCIINNLNNALLNKDDTFPEIIILQLNLIIELLGGLKKQNIGNKRVYKKKRNIEYIIDMNQKANIIMNSIYFLEMDKVEIKKLEDQFKFLKYNSKDFVMWFKLNYPKYYSTLF